MLAIGTDRVVYSTTSSPAGLYGLNQAPSLAWNGYRDIGGRNLLMGGVVKLGSNELTAAGIDPAGRLMLSRFDGSNWLQFQPVIGQTSGSPMYRPGFMSLSR